MQLPQLNNIFTIVKQKCVTDIQEANFLPHGITIIVNTISESFNCLTYYEKTALMFQIIDLFEECVPFCHRKIKSELTNEQKAVISLGIEEWRTQYSNTEEDDADFTEPPEVVLYMNTYDNIMACGQFLYFAGGYPPYCDNYVLLFCTQTDIEKCFLEKIIRQFGLSSIHEILAHPHEVAPQKSFFMTKWEHFLKFIAHKRNHHMI